MKNMAAIKPAYAFLCCLAAVCFICAGVLLFHVLNHHSSHVFSIQSTPWVCVGGCGAGGSGGAAGATVKWIGKGVSGGLIDFQAVYSHSEMGKTKSDGLEARLSMKPTYTSTLALTVPWSSKSGVLQSSTASNEEPVFNNGLGDVRIDFINTFGVSGEFSYNFTLTLPSGDYAANWGADNKKRYLPAATQAGSGLCNLNLDLGYTMDFDDAMVLIDAAYSHPFMVNLFGKNQFISSKADNYNSLNTPGVWNQLTAQQKRRFEYYFKPYGENDLGGYTPPSIMVSGYYAYKGMQNLVHSVGGMFSFPLGVAWIPEFDCKTYDPKPDPDHQAWNFTFCYGLEYSGLIVPLYFALYLPIHDKSANAMNTIGGDEYDTKPMAAWNGPDWDEIQNLRRLSIFLGIKTSFF